MLGIMSSLYSRQTFIAHHCSDFVQPDWVQAQNLLSKRSMPDLTANSFMTSPYATGTKDTIASSQCLFAFSGSLRIKRLNAHCLNGAHRPSLVSNNSACNSPASERSRRTAESLCGRTSFPENHCGSEFQRTMVGRDAIEGIP